MEAGRLNRRQFLKAASAIVGVTAAQAILAGCVPPPGAGTGGAPAAAPPPTGPIKMVGWGYHPEIVEDNVNKFKESYSEEVDYQLTTGGGGGVQARAILISMKNSAIVAVVVTLFNLLIGAPAGYAYARFARYRISGITLWLMMMKRMIPALTLAVPFFVLFRALGLNDTIIGLIIAYSSLILPLVVWITKGYFETLPPNMERAALVDGCNRWQSFIRVVTPVAIPGLMAAGIFCFLVAWNEFVYALLLTSSLNAQTLPTRIPQFVADQRIYNPGLLFAAGVLAIIPPVLIAFVFQRYLLQGMLSGATKG